MEVKKTSKADLESGRTQRFLLGLVVALACLFVGFEYTVEPDDPLDDPDLLAQLSQDSELAPIMRQKDMIELAPEVEPPPTTKLKIAEEEPAEQREEEQVESDLGDDLPSVEDEELQKEEEPEGKPEEKSEDKEEE
jgi:protein TonB